MKLNILVVPDKFKGTLTAAQAAAAIHQGWNEIRPNDRIEEQPMADGGDGFGEVLGQLLGADRQLCATVDSAGRARVAEWWLNRDTRTAVVETAQVNGLALLPAGKYRPFDLDTFGIGAVLKQAAGAGARYLYVGIGGSSTNDGGFGLARALGWRFLDASGAEIPIWTGLETLTKVVEPSNPLAFDELIIAVDVNNPLLGAEGASRAYGLQKELREEEDIVKAEACLARLAEIMATLRGEDFSLYPGAGAAGGLGFGLKAFCGGKFESGAGIFMRESRLVQRIEAADLIITGEGKMDTQTLRGKGVGVIAEAAARAGKPCICLAGFVDIDTACVPWSNFKSYAIVSGIVTSEESQTHAADCLRRLARHAAQEFH